MIAYEAQHYLKMKTQGKYDFVALKLDMSKTYDRAEWTLLNSIVIKMGFRVEWTKLIWGCITFVQYHILIEENKLGPITPKDVEDKETRFPLVYTGS